MPAGLRPYSPPKKSTTPLTGTKRNRAVEHSHVFADIPELPPTDPSNCYWLYGAFDYKIQCPADQARLMVGRIIDKLVERMKKLIEAYVTANAVQPKDKGRRMSSACNPPLTYKEAAKQQEDVIASTTAHKAHLLFDIISTKKHIAAGLPYKLGEEIYQYVDATHGSTVVTTFVGLTDNTARRVARDIYFTKSDELSKNHIPFTAIDREHLFIVFPAPSVLTDVEPSRERPRASRNPFNDSNRRQREAHRAGSHRRAGNLLATSLQTQLERRRQA